MIKLWGRKTGQTTWAKLGVPFPEVAVVTLYAPREQAEDLANGCRQFCRTLKGRWAFFDGISERALAKMPPDGMKGLTFGFERKEDATLFRLFYSDYDSGA